MVVCHDDAEGRLGIAMTDLRQQIAELPAGFPAAKQGLLRVGDRVLSCDGIALRMTTLAKAHASSLSQEHVLLVDRQDDAMTEALMNLPAKAVDECLVAELLSAKLVVPKQSRRMRGSTCTRLGLELNKFNVIEAISPSSVASIDDTLRKDDVIVELNGNSLRQARLADELKKLPKPLDHVVLTVVRMPQTCKNIMAQALTESAEPAVSRMNALFGSMLAVGGAGACPATGHTWTTYQEALNLTGGNPVAARLIMQKDRENFAGLDKMAVMIQARWRGKKVRKQIAEARQSLKRIQRAWKMRIALMRKKQKKKEVQAALLMQTQFRRMQAPKRERESLIAKAETHKLTALTRMTTFKDHRKHVEQAHRTGEGILTQTTTLKGSLGDLSSSEKDSMRTNATYSFAEAIGVDSSMVEVKLEDGSIKLVTTIHVAQGQSETVEAAMQGLASNPSRIADMLKVPQTDIMSVSEPKKKSLVEMRWGRARTLTSQKLVVNVDPKAFEPPPVFQRPTSEMNTSDIAKAMLKQVGMKRQFMEYADIDSQVPWTGLIELVTRHVRGHCNAAREAVRSESIKLLAVRFVHAVQARNTEEAMDWQTFQSILVELASGDICQQGLHGSWELVLDEDIQRLRKAQHRRRRVQLETHTHNRGIVYPKYNVAKSPDDDDDDDDDDDRPSPSRPTPSSSDNGTLLDTLVKSDRARISSRDRTDSTGSTLSSRIRMHEQAAREGHAVELAISMTSQKQAARVSNKPRLWSNMGNKDTTGQKMSYFGAQGQMLVEAKILAHDQLRPRAYNTNPETRHEEHKKQTKMFKSLQKRVKKNSLFDVDLGLGEWSPSLRSPKLEATTCIFTKFIIGTRVKSRKGKIGTVTEHMESGKTIVKFDSGEECEFKPRQMRKFKSIEESPQDEPADADGGNRGAAILGGEADGGDA